MDALAAHRRAIRTDFAAPVLPRLARMLALATIALVAVTGLVIGARRATGALVVPLSPGVLAGLGIVLAGVAVVFRRSIAGLPLSRLATCVVWAVPSLALLAWAAAVTLAGSETLGLVAFVGALLLEEGWSWGRLRSRAETPSLAIDLPIKRVVVSPADDAHEPDVEIDEAVSQHIVRRRGEAGEVIEGWVRVELAAAQRHAAAHVAICPPLDRVPECYAEQRDGPSAQVKVAQVLAYGVRFDVKLEEPSAEPTSVVIEFSIQDSGASTD